MGKYKKEKPKVKCVVCGNIFELPRPSSKQVACSRACANVIKTSKTYTCNCKDCGQVFEGNSPSANWCNDCRQFNCLTCGKAFIRTKQSTRYCCPECFNNDKQLRAEIGIKGSKTKQEKIASGTYKVASRKDKEFTCQNCNTISISKSSNTRYCTDCKTSICTVCGKSFHREQFRGQKTCSLECRGKSQTKYRKCKVCGKEFGPRNSTNKFCSRECYNKHQLVPENNPNYSSSFHEVTCAICGENKLVAKWETKNWVTCSRECSAVWQSIRKPKETAAYSCIMCNKQFEISPPYLAKKRKVCSSECLANFRSKNNAALSADGKVKYNKGYYISKITKQKERYDSDYELKRFEQLDSNGIKWTKKHGIRISYWWEGRQRHYVPDILVYTDKLRLEEVKPKHLATYHEKTKVKLRAGKNWCERKGYDFVIITEDNLF